MKAADTVMAGSEPTTETAAGWATAPVVEDAKPRPFFDFACMERILEIPENGSGGIRSGEASESVGKRRVENRRQAAGPAESQGRRQMEDANIQISISASDGLH
ncbi:MAG TPA: hypothetical protein VFT89_05790 [Rhizobiaceae bacterium]|nr:hypothetical protein [Rhizobiaceae bacterium]